MRLTVPLTGTVLEEGEVWGKGDLKGDDNDPIRPVSLRLRGVRWHMIDVDLINEVMIIEVEVEEMIEEPILDGEGKRVKDDCGVDIMSRRPATKAEKDKFLKDAKDKVEKHTKDELYEITKCPKLKRKKKE